MGGKTEPPAAGGGGNRLATKGTILTGSDGIIYNSLCVGFDCPTSPTFSDSTILMMENNTRIKFGDTSNSPFPNEDWEIEANSASSGGQSYLGFNDCGSSDNDGGCATDLVFAVEAGARQNALYVESDGDVGIGTSNPVLELHIVRGDSPGVRLEQDSLVRLRPSDLGRGRQRDQLLRPRRDGRLDACRSASDRAPRATRSSSTPTATWGSGRSSPTERLCTSSRTATAAQGS